MSSVLLLLPILYNSFTVPFRVAFYYRAVTREPPIFYALDVAMDMWLWTDILTRVRTLVMEYRQRVNGSEPETPISFRRKVFDFLFISLYNIKVINKLLLSF